MLNFSQKYNLFRSSHFLLWHIPTVSQKYRFWSTLRAVFNGGACNCSFLKTPLPQEFYPRLRLSEPVWNFSEIGKSGSNVLLGEIGQFDADLDGWPGVLRKIPLKFDSYFEIYRNVVFQCADCQPSVFWEIWIHILFSAIKFYPTGETLDIFLWLTIFISNMQNCWSQFVEPFDH